MLASAKTSFRPALFYKKETLIKKRAFESFSRYKVFDGWNDGKSVNTRVIVLIAILKILVSCLLLWDKMLSSMFLIF